MIETEVQEPLAVVEETASPTAVVPEAPETPASSAAAPSSPTDTPPTSSDRPRDEHGRFLKKDGSPVAPEEQAALSAALPATPTTPQAPVTPSFAGEPFLFRADGKKIPVPGAVTDPSGWLHIPPDQVPYTKQMWADAVAHRGSWRQKEQHWQQQVETAGAVEKARAERFDTIAKKLYEALHDESFRAELANDPQRTLAAFNRELGLTVRELKLNAPRVQEQQPAAEPDEAQLTQAFGATLHDEVDELLEDPKLKGLFSPEDIQELKDDFTERMRAYAAEVDGQLMLDRHAVKRAFDREVKTQQRIKQAAAEAAKAREFNEKRNAPPAPIAPVVSTKGPGASGNGQKKFANREEYNKAMGLN